jgi:hypothetical protein
VGIEVRYYQVVLGIKWDDTTHKCLYACVKTGVSYTGSADWTWPWVASPADTLTLHPFILIFSVLAAHFLPAPCQHLHILVLGFWLPGAALSHKLTVVRGAGELLTIPHPQQPWTPVWWESEIQKLQPLAPQRRYSEGSPIPPLLPSTQSVKFQWSG